MFVCDKRGPSVIVSGVWPPIPIEEWQLTMDPRKVEEFRKKWKKDMKAALRELDGSPGGPDQGTKSQPRIRSEKAAPHLPSPSEFPLDFATPQQRIRVDKAPPHLPSAMEFPLDLAMKLGETFEKDSELGNPIVDESDWALSTEHKPMKKEKQEKPAPPRPPPVPQGGSQKASHVSPKMMLLKAQQALKERVANDTKKTKKKKDGRGQTRANGRDLRSNRIAIRRPEVRHTRRSPQRRKRREMEARAYNQTRQSRRKAQRRAYHNRKRARDKIQKKRRAQMKQVTMAHRMQMSRPHLKGHIRRGGVTPSCLLAFHVT